jgi:hypothetical protein
LHKGPPSSPAAWLHKGPPSSPAAWLHKGPPSSAASAGAAIAGAASAGAAIAGAASAGAASAGEAIAGAASAGAASPGPASAGPASAGPASKQYTNPAVACAFAPPVCEPEAEPEPGGGVRFRYRRSANPKPNPNPAVARASAPPVCEPEAEPEQNLLSGDVTPPEDQRSPSADQGLPQQTSGTSYEPVCANPNPVVACASAPPVCEPEAEPKPGGGVRFRTAGLRTRSRLPTAVEGPPSAATCVKEPFGSQV